MPKKGILFFLTYSIALIFPSTPLSPKPGATNTPLNSLRILYTRFYLGEGILYLLPFTP